MKFWWFRQKIRQIIDIIVFIKLIPDLNLRIFSILISILFVVISFSFGYLLGKKTEADRQIVVSGAVPFVQYNEKLLASIHNGKESLYAKDEEEKIFVASLGGTVYYHKSCSGYKRIKEENRVWFNTKEDAEMAGYRIAKNCKF